MKKMSTQSIRFAIIVGIATMLLAACSGGGGNDDDTSPVSYALDVAASGSGTVVSSPAGIDCGNTCNASFAADTMVMLTATAENDYSFTGWGGACSGSGSCTVSMTEAKNVTATFSAVSHNLNVSVSGPGAVTSSPSGIDCGGTCSASYSFGTLVSLVASPDNGSLFSGWSGECSGSGNCTVSMTAARNVTATFTAASHSLNVSVSGPGAVTSSPSGIDCGGTCSASYSFGTLVSLVASPDNGSVFSGWGGECSGSGNCTVSMTAARNVTATFTVSGSNDFCSAVPMLPDAQPNATNTGVPLDTELTVFDGDIVVNTADRIVDAMDVRGSITINASNVTIQNSKIRPTSFTYGDGSAGQDIKELLRAIFQKRSAATVETVHGVISGIFNEAFDEGYVQGNPSSMLLKSILPLKNRRDEKEPNPFNKAELELFLQHARNLCTTKEAMLLKVMAYSGMRLGEALAMQVRNLDTDKARYHVAEQYKLHQYRKPKHGKQRLIDLPDALMPELCAYIGLLRKESLKAGNGGRVGRVGRLFLDPQEGLHWPYSQRRVQRLIERVCRQSDLSRRNPHDLRHTYATILLMAHRSPAYVQKQLGHHSISMTVDIYGHWIPGEGRGGLDEAFGEPAVVRNAVQKPHIIAYEKKRSR